LFYLTSTVFRRISSKKTSGDAFMIVPAHASRISTSSAAELRRGRGESSR